MNNWFRMYGEFATDPKVQMMSEVLQRRFVMLLCIRCNVTGNGSNKVNIQDDEIAFQLRISETEWAETKAVFLAKKLIDEGNNPLAWDKRQYLSDSSAARVRRHREAQKESHKESEKMKRYSNVTVTPPDTDTDTDTELTSKTISPTQARTDETLKPPEDVPEKPKPPPEKKPSSLPCPKDVSETVWRDFLTHRKAKRATVSETVILGIRREADKAGMTLEEAMSMSISRGWQGFNAEWAVQKSTAPPYLTPQQRLDASNEAAIQGAMRNILARESSKNANIGEGNVYEHVTA